MERMDRAPIRAPGTTRVVAQPSADSAPGDGEGAAVSESTSFRNVASSHAGTRPRQAARRADSKPMCDLAQRVFREIDLELPAPQILAARDPWSPPPELPDVEDDAHDGVHEGVVERLDAQRAHPGGSSVAGVAAAHVGTGGDSESANGPARAQRSAAPAAVRRQEPLPGGSSWLGALGVLGVLVGAALAALAIVAFMASQEPREDTRDGDGTAKQHERGER